jgi:hypothetical protein
MEDYLENPKTDEEFYELMRKKREDIDSLQISKEKRNELYSILQNNIDSYKQSKKYIGKEKIDKAYDFFGKSLKEFINASSEVTKQNLSLHFSRINQQITNYHMRKTLERIGYSLQNERKRGARITRKLLWMKMVEANKDSNQNN